MTPHKLAVKAVEDWYGYQSILELEAALNVIRDLAPKTVMEIGVAHGASLAAWAEISGASKVIALDPEDIPRTDDQLQSYNRLAATYNFQRIPLYDRNPEAKNMLEKYLNGDKINFLFIDGAHDFESVLYDFYNYKPYMSRNGVVGFHDIIYNEVLADAGSTCSWFFDRLTRLYHYDLFYNHSTMGIGFIYLGMPIVKSVHEI